MEEVIQLVIKSYGIVGLVMISPFVAMIALWKAYEKVRGELQAANEKISATQDKRVEDAKEVATKLLTMTAEHASLGKETNMALDRVSDMLTVMQNARFAGRAPRERDGS
jgi:predicted sugar kinase